MALSVASVTAADACRELVRGMLSGGIGDGRDRTYKPATVRAYECRLRVHVLPRIRGIPLAALSRGDVRRMVDELAVDASARVARDARGALRVVLRRQVDLEVIPVNVATGVRAPLIDAASSWVLTLDEAVRLQAAADADKDPQVGPFVALALATGMRSGELQALRGGRTGWTPPPGG